jgi:hypothetical protein
MARTRKDPPAATYKKGRKAADELAQSTFSWFMTALEDPGLAEAASMDGNRKEKFYRITEKGGDGVPVWFRPGHQHAGQNRAGNALGKSERGRKSSGKNIFARKKGVK